MNSDVILERLMALHPKVIDLTLDRMHRILAALGHPERQTPPVIHIAGTNGKGSTLAMIRAGLEARGDRVHAYTSPHLARFHERIRLGGRLIDESSLADLLAECEAANGGAPITFFEITTAAAFLAFARTPADHLLLEVGLGGRLDATNVIDPALSVITPVSIDHQQFLGETLPLIAAEKAGILARSRPCVVGPQDEAAMEVIEARAARLGAPLIAHGQHWHAMREGDRLVFQDERGLLDLPLPILPGPHQIPNAGAALAVLRHLDASEEACIDAVARAEWPARMQRLRDHPLSRAASEAELWLDGGHNAAAGIAVAGALSAMPVRPTYLVCGMLRTKDAAGFLAPLSGHVTSLIAVPVPGEGATLSPDETAEAARRGGIARVETASDVSEAVNRITAQDPAARILICGSLYLAGHVLRQSATDSA